MTKSSFLILALIVLLVPTSAFASGDNRPPDNRPPNHQGGDSEQSVVVDVGTRTSASSNVTSGDTVLQGGSQTVNVEFPEGFGSQGTPTTQTVDGDTVSLDAGDSPVAIDTGGNTSKNESNFFALSTTFPNGHGCFGGAQGGGQSGGDGGWLGFHFLNWGCFSNYLAESQESVRAKSRLDCSGRKFRNAIAFDQKGNRLSKQTYCVAFMEVEYTRQIEFERAQVTAALAAGQLALMEGTGSPKT